MLNTLENKYSVPSNLEQVDGVIVLGGGVDWLVSNGREVFEQSGAADRMSAAVALHQQFPDAKILYTGRHGVSGGTQELSVASHFESMGISMNQIYVENQSRNTDENARYSKNMMNPEKDEVWLLVTSAFHMKRALLVFEKSGWDVVPYPVDYRSPGSSANWPYFFDTLTYVDNVSVALKEWIGIAVYKITGKA